VMRKTLQPMFSDSEPVGRKPCLLTCRPILPAFVHPILLTTPVPISIVFPIRSRQLK